VVRLHGQYFGRLVEGLSAAATGLSKSKPTRANASKVFHHVGFFRCLRNERTMRGKRRPIPKVPTQIAGLDEILEGGLPRGRTTLVSGGPGAGKTVLGLEFLCRGAMAGEPGVFITFEERADAIRLNARSMGWDLPALEKAGKMAIVEARLPGEEVLAGDFDIQGMLAIAGGTPKGSAPGGS
jgi:predicted ATP-dependent serine protease